MNEIATFQYPDNTIAEQCEQIATAVEVINAGRVLHDVKCRLEMGRLLNQAKVLLEHGQFGPWLRWRLPDWSAEAIRGWRVMAERADQNPTLWENVKLFHSVKAAEEYVLLPEATQERVIEEQAFTWSKFKAVQWDAAMRDRLEDDKLDRDTCFGDVLFAIEEAKDDPALNEVATALYQEHRDMFARLADREPTEVDVEVGIKTTREPTGDAPRAQMIEGDSGYWLCKWDGEKFNPVAAVSAHLLMWNGKAEPSLLAAFPKTNDGPASVSWQSAVMDAACRRVNASTLASTYGEVL